MKYWWAYILTWLFIIIKAFGTSLAAWSWWWGFLPLVPLVGELVIRFGL